MIHDFCLQFFKEGWPIHRTDGKNFTGFKTRVRRKKISLATNKENHEQKQNNKTKLDSRLANGFRQDTDTKVLLLHLSKMIDVS